MDNKKIIFVYPKDETTDFLQEIIDFVIDETEADVSVIRITTTKEHYQFLETADQIPNTSIIIFMGHGMSDGLSGAYVEELMCGPLISKQQLDIFRGKKIMLLSCRSNEYLSNYHKTCGLQSSIGFPNLITDHYEMYYSDESRQSGIGDEDVKLFRSNLINIIKNSLIDYINLNLSFFSFYRRIKLRTQKILIDYYENKEENISSAYGKMLVDLNQGINFSGN